MPTLSTRQNSLTRLPFRFGAWRSLALTGAHWRSLAFTGAHWRSIARALAKLTLEIRKKLVQRRGESGTARQNDLHFARSGAFGEPAGDAFASFNSPAELRQVGSVEHHLTRDP